MSARTAWPSVVTVDDHTADMDILLSALPADLPRRGVVHVGAHRGEEVPVFQRFGFRDVLLIEANPLHASMLQERFAGDGHLTVLSTAVGDRVGEADLLVHISRSGSTEPASLLRLQALQEIVPTVTTAATVRVPMTTLDELARQGTVGTDRYNLLVVDVQGAERLVFEGASRFIARCDAIVTEVNLVPLYEGAPLEEELLDHLRGMGFAPRQSVYHELYKHENRFLAWGECLLLRDGHAADQARTATPIPVRP